MRAFQFSHRKYNDFAVTDLKILRFTEQQNEDLMAIDETARKIKGFYVYQGVIYHLHPEFIESNEELSPRVSICNACTYDIKKNKIPKFSLAAGVDFGNPGRVGLREPTIIEQYCIAFACPYVTVFKLIGGQNNQRQFSKKGHAITYLHDSPFEFSAHQTLPRVEGIAKVISVCFVGSNLVWEAFQPTFKTAVPDLVVRPDVVYSWLHYLKQVNPLYKDIEIVDTLAVREALQSLTDQLISNAVVMDDGILTDMETVIAEETATYGNEGDSTNLIIEVDEDAMEERYDFLSNDPISIGTQTTITPIPISHCFVNNTNAIQTGNSDPISAIFNSVEKALSQSVFRNLVL